MSLLSPRLQLKVAQKQILTPGLVQMVTVLQLNRLELKEMITQEIVKNPVLEESTEETGRRDHRRGIAAAAGGRAGHRSGRQADSGSRRAERCQLAGRARRATSPSTATCSPMPRRPPPRRGTGGHRHQRSAAGSAGRHRPVRRDRFRLVLRRLPGPRLQEPRLGIGREAVLRDLSFLAGHAGRSSALAVERQRDARRQSATPPNPSSATWTKTAIFRLRWRRSPPSGEHKPEHVEAGPAGGAVARPGRRGRAQPARVPAAADRKRQRQGRRGLADRLQPSAAARNPAVQGDRQGAGAAAGAHRDRRAA